jgi:hypothetical protein
MQLRQMLREKFPGLVTSADQLPVQYREGWQTGITKLDERLGGGFPKSALSEVIAPRTICGSALLLVQLLYRAASQNQFTALIDGCDSFDAAAVEQSTLSRLLWVRCHNVDEALKATDLVLRDGNLPVVLLDLVLNPAAELRKIPAPTWYRFQRIIEESGTTFIVFTPRAMVMPAEARVTLCPRFDFCAFERTPNELVGQLDFEISQEMHLHREFLRHSA